MSIPNCHAAATVVVTSSEGASVLRLDAHSVTQLLGPLQQALDRGMAVATFKAGSIFQIRFP